MNRAIGQGIERTDNALLDGYCKDALRFRFLQNLPVVEAQAFFWNYGSRTERAKAIDKAMHALIDRMQTP